MKKTGLLLGIALAAALGCAGEPGDVIRQRQAFRRDVEAHPEKLEHYLKSPDAVIRRYALYLVVKQKGKAAKEICKTAMKDPNEQIRLTALGALLHYCRKDADVQKILAETAASDKSREVAKMAADAAWPFHREVVLIRNNPFWDHAVTTLRKDRIPDNNWKFQLDPRGIGHLPHSEKKR